MFHLARKTQKTVRLTIVGTLKYRECYTLNRLEVNEFMCYIDVLPMRNDLQMEIPGLFEEEKTHLFFFQNPLHKFVFLKSINLFARFPAFNIQTV